MTRRRTLLRPPRDLLRRSIWLASGPGRASQLEKWARSIKPGDARYALACEVRGRVALIRRWYRKGATDYATLQLDQLSGEIRGELRQRVARTVGAKGGRKSAQTKKAEMAAWQKGVHQEVVRLLRTGLTPPNIGARLADRAGVSAGTVAKYARQVAREPGIKK